MGPKPAAKPVPLTDSEAYFVEHLHDDIVKTILAMRRADPLNVSIHLLGRLMADVVMTSLIEGLSADQARDEVDSLCSDYIEACAQLTHLVERRAAIAATRRKRKGDA